MGCEDVEVVIVVVFVPPSIGEIFCGVDAVDDSST